MTTQELAALTRYVLDTHHALLHRELPRLEVALVGASPRLRVPFGNLKRVMDLHLMKEEQILFPAIRNLSMRMRHRVVGNLGSARLLRGGCTRVSSGNRYLKLAFAWRRELCSRWSVKVWGLYGGTAPAH